MSERDQETQGFTAAKLEELRRTHAATRSHQNAKIVDDYAISLMASMLVVNGTAIGAVLTAVATEKVFTTAGGTTLSAAAVLSFGIGVAAALAAVLLQRRNIAGWRNIWEQRVHGDLDGGTDTLESDGRSAEGSLWVSVIAFLAGVAFIALSLYLRAPSSAATAGPARGAEHGLRNTGSDQLFEASA